MPKNMVDKSIMLSEIGKLPDNERVAVVTTDSHAFSNTSTTINIKIPIAIALRKPYDFLSTSSIANGNPKKIINPAIEPNNKILAYSITTCTGHI